MRYVEVTYTKIERTAGISIKTTGRECASFDSSKLDFNSFKMQYTSYLMNSNQGITELRFHVVEMPSEIAPHVLKICQSNDEEIKTILPEDNHQVKGGDLVNQFSDIV